MRRRCGLGCLWLLGLLLSLDLSCVAIDPLTLKNGVWNKTRYTCVIRSLLEDRHGNLWIGSFGAGLWRYDGRDVASIPANAAGYPDSRISKLLIDGDRIFVATAGGGAAVYDADKQLWKPLAASGSVASEHFHAFIRLSDGRFLLGSVGDGLFIGKDADWKQITEGDGLTNDWVNDALEIPQGILAATSQGLTLIRDGRAVDAFLPTSGWADGNINVIYRFGDRIFLGMASSGLTAMTLHTPSEPQKTKAGRLQPGFEQVASAPAQIHALLAYDGRLFVGTEVGLYVVDDELKCHSVSGDWPAESAIKALGLYKNELVVGTAAGEVYHGKPGGSWRRVFRYAEFTSRGGPHQ